MERILSVEQMRFADAYTIEKLGVPEQVLVERAGTAVAEEIVKRFRGGRVLVCVGKGNNGADGNVVAEILKKIHGFTVYTVNVSNGIFKLFEQPFDIIVDCIFGTGLDREVEGKYKTAIEKINNSGAYVVSCDIPSGINGNAGTVMGVAVKANLTVAIQEYKLGHFLNDGVDYAGEVVAKDIGISVWEDECYHKISDEDAKKYFPTFNRNVNKGSFKKCSVIGGSKKYPGSALLSTNALIAMKMGNGYSNLAFPDCIFSLVAGRYPECNVLSLKSDGESLTFDKEGLDELMKYDALAFGMGVGVSEENYKIIGYLLKNYKGRLLIDADGLNTLSAFGVYILKDKSCEVVLTPHVLEFARLTGKEKTSVITDGIDLAKDFAKEYQVVVLLKSAVSVITDGESVILNVTGSSGQAKAGSGDVLSGIVLGLMSRIEDVKDAVTVGAYIFGKAGELVEKKQNQYTMTASDVINALPEVINAL